MRVLMVHNRYRQAGGEDAVVRDEAQLLTANGVAVEHYERHNDEIADGGGRLRLAADTLWSRRTEADIAALVAGFRPDVIHAHNTFPLISPSLYYAAARHGVPVVQTLHNFRLFCPQAMFMRNGRVCEDCLGRLPWRGVLRRCYRDSAAQSAVLVGMLGVHRALGTWRHGVARYIALNDFCRDKFIAAGLPAERIAVKPNFVDLSPPPAGAPRHGGLFVGRLSAEKGVATLAAAAAALPGGAAIAVVGTGPEQALLEGAPGIRLLGWQAPEFVYARMRRSAWLVMPSVWYENFPRTLVEAFACGLPVIASRLGAMADLVREGDTGLLFRAGDAADLARALAWAGEHPAEMRRMGEAARREYEAKYTPAKNFARLMSIYASAGDGREARALQA